MPICITWNITLKNFKASQHFWNCSHSSDFSQKFILPRLLQVITQLHYNVLFTRALQLIIITFMIRAESIEMEDRTLNYSD